MKVLEIATNDLRGGAARSAYRLHQGLRESAIDVSMLVRWKQSSDPSVHELAESFYGHEYVERERVLRQRWVRDNRTDMTDTLFSLGSPSIQIATHPLVQSADIIHLHWCANFLGPGAFAGLAELGTPIVWTIHDEWAYTGGCHYRAGCERHRTRCTACPQLREDPLSLVSSLFAERCDAWRDANLTIVGPSKWIAERAKESAILARHPRRVIPYGLDTQLFCPATNEERSAFRQRLDVSDDAVLFAFGVDRLGERRKGHDDLVAAFEIVARRLPRAVLVRFGDAAAARPPHLPTIDLGAVNDDRELARIYASSDCFILPTREDNLPNGVLESMACGTPVIAYATGGVPEMIDDGKTGVLVASGEIPQLAETIVEASATPAKLRAMGIAARTRVEQEHTLARQASRYVGLYASLLAGRSKAAGEAA